MKEKLPSAPSPSAKTSSGIVVKESYERSDGAASSEQPGEFPYTRGIHRSMYRGKPWTMRQYAGFGTASESNLRYHYLLKQGITGLSVAFDLPTQMGRDADHALARGEVGRVGVSICTVGDMEELLRGIPLKDVSISMTINATASILLGLLLVVAERRGDDWKLLRGTIQNDVLKEYLARGTYIYPPQPALRIVTDIFEFCSGNVPQWNTISISGYHIREAGSTAVQEIAFTLANGICYVEAALKRGLAIDSFAPRLAFFFNAHSDFLEEVSKFRAARRLWAKIMKERFQAKDPKSLMMRFHAQTAGSSLTAQQPQNNIVRTTVEALAAALGGAQSIHTNGYDEALCLPSEESARIALRTQQILLHESGIAAVADPLGGSYAIENLTNEIETRVQAILNKIDDQGGMLKSLEIGFPQNEIEQAAYEHQKKIESNEQIVVGVNEFISSEEGPSAPTILTPQGEIEQKKKLEALRASRDNGKVSAALSTVSLAAQGTDNLMPVIIEALRCSATLGEISDAMRAVFGTYRP